MKVFAASLLIFSFHSAWAQSVQFDPETPLYIEYVTNPAVSKDEVSVDIQDSKSPSRIRLNLQAKPNEAGKYYGYIWLQIGKKVTNEVSFLKGKKQSLTNWKTTQDGIQALFLFDAEDDKKSFIDKSTKAQQPIVDRSKLPTLVNPTGAAPVTAAAKSLDAAFNAELSEASRYEKLIAAYDKLTPQQKALNDKKAAQLAELGLKSYRAKQYANAEKQFSESLRFNPTNTINKYYLALCHYQLKKYDRSLALLNLAEGSDYNYAEYNYYKGLNNLKLKTYEQALDSFENARDEKDPDYSGPSAFFMGHIYFQQEKYPESRKNFEFTIDHSKNAKMDNEAEMMIEKIDYIDGFKNKMNQRFTYNLFAGFGYDSNILNISTENLSTNLTAYRLLYGAQGNYKLFFDHKHDLSVEATVSDYYSLNSTLQSDTTVQTADPLQVSVGLPYHRRFELKNRILTWGLYPSYSTINMSLDGGTRKKIVDTMTVGTDVMFAQTNNLFSRYYLEYAQDKSALEVTSTENDPTATKYTASTTQTWMLSPTERKSVDFDLGYTLNAADGDNYDYGKIAAAVQYNFLGIWDAMNMIQLGYNDTNYNNSTTGRKDQVATLMLGLSKDLTRQLNLGLNGTYTLSQSSIDTYDYNKMLIQSLLTYSGAF